MTNSQKCIHFSLGILLSAGTKWISIQELQFTVKLCRNPTTWKFENWQLPFGSWHMWNGGKNFFSKRKGKRKSAPVHSLSEWWMYFSSNGVFSNRTFRTYKPRYFQRYTIYGYQYRRFGGPSWQYLPKWDQSKIHQGKIKLRKH